MAANRTAQEFLRVLGLKKGASADEIKKAYKNLALLHHPDKNHGDQAATEMFQKVSEAYTYLMKEEEDEDQSEFYEDDITLIDLLRLFARLSRRGPGDRCNCAHCNGYQPSSTLSGGARIVINPFGIGIYDEDDDDDYELYSDRYGSRQRLKARSAADRYQFTCEDSFGEPGRNRYKGTKSAKRTVAVGREPSKKWMRKQMKREYNSYKSDEEKEFKAFNEEEMYWEKEKGESPREMTKQKQNEEEEEKVKSNSLKTDLNNNSKSKKDSKQEKAPPPKKLTKKQLAAEQRRREREIAQIAEDLDKEKQKEIEKEQKRQERERARQEELKKTITTPLKNYQKGKDPALDSDMKQRLIDSQKEEMKQSEIMKDYTPKNKDSKRKKRQRKKGSDVISEGAGLACTLPEGPTRGEDEWLESGGRTAEDRSSGWIEESQAKSTGNTVKDNVVVLKHLSDSHGKCYVQRGLSSHRESAKAYNNAKSSSVTITTNSAKQARSEPGMGSKSFSMGSSSGGIRRNRENTYQKFVPPRMQPQARSHQPFGSEPVGSSPVTPWSQVTSFPQSSQQGQSEPHSTGKPSQPGSAWTINPPPAPAQNVWRQRQEFYQGALPSNEMEERAMLEAALKMSKLQAQEEQLTQSIEEEEYRIKMAEQEMKRKQKEKKQQEDFESMRDKFSGLGAGPAAPSQFAAAVGSKPREVQNLIPIKVLSTSESNKGTDSGYFKSASLQEQSSQPVQQMAAETTGIKDSSCPSRPAGQSTSTSSQKSERNEPDWQNFSRLPKMTWPPSTALKSGPEVNHPPLPGAAGQPNLGSRGGFGGAKPKAPMVSVPSSNIPGGGEENWEDELMTIPMPTPIGPPTPQLAQEEDEESSSGEYESGSDESGSEEEDSSGEELEIENTAHKPTNPSCSKIPPGLDADLAADLPSRTNPVGTVKPTVHPPTVHPAFIPVKPGAEHYYRPGPSGEPGAAQQQTSDLTNLFGYSNTWPMVNFGSLPYFAGRVPMVPSYPACHPSPGNLPQAGQTSPHRMPQAAQTPTSTTTFSPLGFNSPSPSIPGMPNMMPATIPLLPGIVPMMGLPYINPQVLQAYQANLASHGISPMGGSPQESKGVQGSVNSEQLTK